MANSQDFGTRRFLSSDVAQAAGIEPATLKAWISREPAIILMSDDDRRAAASGGRHLFSLRRVIHVAITSELVAMGLPPRRSGLLPHSFTDLGRCARLFPKHLTYFVVLPGMDSACVVNANPQASLQDFIDQLEEESRGRADDLTPRVIVDLNALYAQVFDALGLHALRR